MSEKRVLVVDAVVKALGKRPQTITQIAEKLGKDRSSVFVQLSKLKKLKGVLVELTDKPKGTMGRTPIYTLRRA